MTFWVSILYYYFILQVNKVNWHTRIEIKSAWYFSNNIVTEFLKMFCFVVKPVANCKVEYKHKSHMIYVLLHLQYIKKMLVQYIHNGPEYLIIPSLRAARIMHWERILCGRQSFASLWITVFSLPPRLSHFFIPLSQYTHLSLIHI